MPTTNKTAQIGRFDKELKTIAFREGDKVSDILYRAGLTLGQGEEVNDDCGNAVSVNDEAEEQTYFITANYKNGVEEAETEEDGAEETEENEE